MSDKTDHPPYPAAFEALGARPEIWIGPLQVDLNPESVSGIELVSWRAKNGTMTPGRD